MKKLFLILLTIVSFTSFGQYTPTEDTFSKTYTQIRMWEKSDSIWVYSDGSCVYDLCGEYFAPNTFTPNNDGLNDGWAIITDPECWLEWQVLIYDRWGRIVWESTIPGEVWVGSNNNGSYYVADGVYVYLVRGIVYNPSNTFEFTGTITIFR